MTIEYDEEYGFSNDSENFPILNHLGASRIFRVFKHSTNKNVLTFEEACDEHFEAYLTSEDLYALAEELAQLAEIIKY